MQKKIIVIGTLKEKPIKVCLSGRQDKRLIRMHLIL